MSPASLSFTDKRLDLLSSKDDQKKIVPSRFGVSIRSWALNGEAEDNSSYRRWERQGARPKDRQVQPPVDPLLLPKRREQEHSKWQGAELSQQEDLSTGSWQVREHCHFCHVWQA